VLEPLKWLHLTKQFEFTATPPARE
jgi:hypothetical protein